VKQIQDGGQKLTKSGKTKLEIGTSAENTLQGEAEEGQEVIVTEKKVVQVGVKPPISRICG